MIPFFLLQAAGGSSARQPPTTVLEFPSPHIAVLRPSPAIARSRKSGIVAAVAMAVAICLVVMSASIPGKKFQLESLLVILPMLFFFICFGVVLLVVTKRSTLSGIKCITFDRRQAVVWKEARKLEPIWQGGIRLRDIASFELAATPLCGFAKGFSLDMVMSRPQGEKVRLIAHGNRDAMKADAAELARFLNIPLADRTV